MCAPAVQPVRPAARPAGQIIDRGGDAIDACPQSGLPHILHRLRLVARLIRPQSRCRARPRRRQSPRRRLWTTPVDNGTGCPHLRLITGLDTYIQADSRTRSTNTDCPALVGPQGRAHAWLWDHERVGAHEFIGFRGLTGRRGVGYWPGPVTLGVPVPPLGVDCPQRRDLATCSRPASVTHAAAAVADYLRAAEEHLLAGYGTA